MGTTADKLNKLLNTKQEIKQAIKNKGVDIDDSTKFADYPSKIDSIPMEGVSPYYKKLWNYITNNGTIYNYLFEGFSGTTTLDLSNLETRGVIGMTNMFKNCGQIQSLDLSNFDTSSVVSMQSMFDGCYAIKSIDISNWDTSECVYMNNMFYYCQEVTTITGINNFDTSKVTNINNMFAYCKALTSLDVSNFDIINVTGSTSLNNAFNNCTSLVDFFPPKNINANMNVNSSTELSHDSLMRIINNLMTTTSTRTLTLGATNKAKLTAEEIAIATNKGWTVA